MEPQRFMLSVCTDAGLSSQESLAARARVLGPGQNYSLRYGTTADFVSAQSLTLSRLSHENIYRAG
jgi:hypothetical protein